MSKQPYFKSLKFFFYTIILMFSAPVVLYEAFKNQQHPLYWPVFIVGALLALAAISMGFYSIKLLMDAIFDKKEK